MIKKIKNLDKAAARIKKAILHQENIIIYGDVDPDGVTSVVILKEAIEALGGSVAGYYFPDRSKEGYGLNKEALKYLSPLSPALIILVDLGIGNYKEVNLAKKKGFQVVIVDHHKVLKMPLADVVVDPYQAGETYPFHDFSAAGLCYKLAQVLLKKNPRQPELERDFSELACLSTIADMMPLKKDNEGIVEEGMKNLLLTSRLSLQVLVEKFSPDFQTAENIVRKVIGVLNASQVQENHLAESFLLLTSKDPKEVRALIARLAERSLRHHQARDKAVQLIEEKIKDEDPIIFEGSREWLLSIAGSVASILVKRYRKPVFLYNEGKDISTGSVRTPKEVDSVKLMEKCHRFLLSFGGHPQASGFRLKNANLSKFKKCLEKHYDGKN